MIYILAEGHGEVEAAGKLIHKIWNNLGLPSVPIGIAKKWPNLHLERGIQKGIEFIRSKKDIDGLIILRDDEDNCPAKLAPKIGEFIRRMNAPFPISYIIMYREFETLFVAYLTHFRGKTIKHNIGKGFITFNNDIYIPENPESIRDAKGEISNALTGSFRYKPTTDQLTLTQALDIDLLRATNLPCFGSLERGILHIANNVNKGSVYPF